MENNRPTAPEVDQSEDIVAKARANKKTILTIFVVAVLCVIAALAYIMIAQSGSKKADEAIAKADAAQNAAMSAMVASSVSPERWDTMAV